MTRKHCVKSKYSTYSWLYPKTLFSKVSSRDLSRGLPRHNTYHNHSTPEDLCRCAPEGKTSPWKEWLTAMNMLAKRQGPLGKDLQSTGSDQLFPNTRPWLVPEKGQGGATHSTPEAILQQSKLFTILRTPVSTGQKSKKVPFKEEGQVSFIFKDKYHKLTSMDWTICTAHKTIYLPFI